MLSWVALRADVLWRIIVLEPGVNIFEEIAIFGEERKKKTLKHVLKPI